MTSKKDDEDIRKIYEQCWLHARYGGHEDKGETDRWEIFIA
jgi:hypothetical protein